MTIGTKPDRKNAPGSRALGLVSRAKETVVSALTESPAESRIREALCRRRLAAERLEGARGGHDKVSQALALLEGAVADEFSGLREIEAHERSSGESPIAYLTQAREPQCLSVSTIPQI
jgi:hypothetical protein